MLVEHPLFEDAKLGIYKVLIIKRQPGSRNSYKFRQKLDGLFIPVTLLVAHRYL